MSPDSPAAQLLHLALPTLAQAGDAAAGAADAAGVPAGAGGVEFGPFLAWWKIALLLVVFLVWLRLMLWVDKDSLDARMPREKVNVIPWAGLVLAMLAAIFLPFFVLALAAVVVLFLASFGAYLIWRKQVVGLEDIPEQLSGFFANLFTFKRGGGRGPKKKTEAEVAMGSVTLLDAKGNAPPAPDDDSPIRPGYETAHRLLSDPLYKSAQTITLVQLATKDGGERYATKYRVDGFDYPGSAYDPAAAAGAMDFLKALAGLEPEERRRLQEGRMKARTGRGLHDLAVKSSGTRTGESMVFEVDPKDRYADRATALGMTPQQRQIVEDAVKARGGIVLLAAPPGGGLDALLYGFVREHDAFTQFIQTLERDPRRELEGITQQQVEESATPEEERKKLSWLADQRPDVLMVDRVPAKADGAGEVIRMARGDGDEASATRVYLGTRANDTAGAINGWLKVAGPNTRHAVTLLRLAVAGRVMRKLCEACKVPYEPGASVLAKMGVPKGKVKTLYKARTEPALDPRGNPVECEFCGGLGYQGRIGAFEVLPLDDKATAALRKDPSSQTVRNLLRELKLPTINEAAIRQVVAGRTDLAEVQRVMGGGGSSSAKKPAAAPAKKPAAAAAK